MQAQPQPAADSIPLGRPLSSGPAPAEGPAPRSWPLPPPQVALTSGCGHSPGPFVAPEASAQARPESPQACRAWSSPRPVLPGRVVSRGRRAAAATGEKAPSPPPAGRAAVAPSSHLPTALGGPPPRRVPRPWAVSRDTHSPPRQASAFQLSCQRRTRSSCGRLGAARPPSGPSVRMAWLEEPSGGAEWGTVRDRKDPTFVPLSRGLHTISPDFTAARSSRAAGSGRVSRQQRGLRVALGERGRFSPLAGHQVHSPVQKVARTVADGTAREH